MVHGIDWTWTEINGCSHSLAKEPIHPKHRNMFEASHKHIQRMRNCVAASYMAHQRACIAALPRARHVAIEISFDETEMPALVGRLVWTAAGTGEKTTV